MQRPLPFRIPPPEADASTRLHDLIAEVRLHQRRLTRARTQLEDELRGHHAATDGQTAAIETPNALARSRRSSEVGSV